MKHLTFRSVLVLASLLASATLSAAVPLHWTVETSRATPATFEAYQGETIALEAALQSYGKPLEAPSNYSLYWQTNGMGSTYWSVPCIQTFEQSEHSNILYATWSPTNDVGAKVYNCFIGQPGTIYHAAFQLRLRPSPGETPNELPLPQKVIDFAKVTVLNPPWSGGGGGGGVDTNAVIDIANATIETNDTVKSLSSSVSGLQALKADKTNTYTKAETNANLGDKRDLTDAAVWEKVGTGPWSHEPIELPEGCYFATEQPVVSVDAIYWDVYDADGEMYGWFDYNRIAEEPPFDDIFDLNLYGYGGFQGSRLRIARPYTTRKVTPARSFVHAPDATTTGIAAFDGKGRLKAAAAGTDYATPGQLDGKLSVVDDGGDKVVTETIRFRESTHFQSYLYLPSWSYLTDGLDGLPEYLASGEWNTDEDDPFAKVSQLPAISATDTTFSNAVDQIVRSLMPTKLRAYDPVRQCWWNIQPVNGVLTLTVED